MMSTEGEMDREGTMRGKMQGRGRGRDGKNKKDMWNGEMMTYKMYLQKRLSAVKYSKSVPKSASTDMGSG